MVYEATADPHREPGLRSVERIMNPPLLPGVNIVKTKDGRETTEFSAGIFGQSDELVNIDTVYDVASITKLYTAALVLRQVQAKKIGLDDRMALYMKQGPFDASSLTVRDLLAHRVDYGFGLAEYRDKFHEHFKEALLGVRAPERPTDTINYHNLNYIYLGYILEYLTGRTLHEQMTQFFADLGLHNTFIGKTVRELGINCPATEVLEDGSFVEGITHDESARLHGGLAGNAGVFASARDLAKFGGSWMTGEIVDNSLLQEAFHNYDASGKNPQGLGWWMRLKNGKKLPVGVYGHSGFTGCYLAINTNTREVTAVTTNRTLLGRDNEADQAVWEAVL